MSRKAPTPEELAAKRAQRRAGNNPPKPPEGEAPPADSSSTLPAVPEPPTAPPVIAQGRPQPMLRLQELPEAIDAPDAQGPLSADEEERWELCRRSFKQAREAWFVAAKALDIALRGRLWRADFATAEAFIAAEAEMSTSNAYRQIAGAKVAEVLAATPRPALESNGKSNDLSRTRDSVRDVPGIVISQRAAEALTSVSKRYSAPVAAKVYTTIATTAGLETVPSRVIEGIVHQLPRGQELTVEQLLEQVRTIAVQQQAAAADPVKVFAGYVTEVSAFARRTRGLADVYEQAMKADPAETAKLVKRLQRHMDSAGGNFPRFPVP